MKRGWMMALSNETSKKPLFLVRPSPIKDEGVAEYLQRLAKVNGLATVSMICSLLKVPLNEIVVSGHAKLQAVIHGHSDALSLRPVERSQLRFTAYRDQHGVSNPCRICISCLKETDLINSAWSEPLAISCQTHREVLQDHCPRCFRLILRTGSQYFCKCGQLFAELNPIPAPAWESTFQELFMPWKISKHKLHKLENYVLRENRSAKLLRKIMNASGHNSVIANTSPSKNRIFTSDFAYLDKAADSNFDFSNLWETAPLLAEKLNQQRRHLEKQNADSISNVARIIGCDKQAASKDSLNNPLLWRRLS